MGLQFYRQAASAWTSGNPTLEAGQPGFETDTGLLKIGDGTTAWTSLPYVAQETIIAALSDETTDLEVATSVLTMRMPFAMTLTAVRTSVGTAPTGAAVVVDINETGVSILSTPISIDATEKTSTTSATPAVISDAALADDAEITFDIDQIGSTVAGAGLKVYMTGYRT